MRVKHEIGWIQVCTGTRKQQEAVRNVVSSSPCSVEEGRARETSSQSFFFEMCSESWDCGFCTMCSCEGEGSNCIPMTSGLVFSVARDLAAACLGKKYTQPLDFLFAWMLGRAKRGCG